VATQPYFPVILGDYLPPVHRLGGARHAGRFCGRTHDDALLCAFDLLELDGEDLRGAPIEVRKAALAKLLSLPGAGIVLNAHYEAEGVTVYRQALCARVRGHRLEAARLALRSRPRSMLGQGQEPAGASGAPA
jgi:hypothetical protein